MSNEIIMINVNKIDPHPDNPRKELGDLSELAESIKSNGIMQNLTVVPWFSEIDKNKKMNGMYRCLIGHRRLAAAKLAGLEQVPCAVAENLTPNEQVAIMLAENVQRKDLNKIEEADGIQMMLDLGDTKDKICERTGFCLSRVYDGIRTRKKIDKFGRDFVVEKFNQGIPLTVFDDIEKIKDPERQKKVLEAIGTENFKWKLNGALDEEKKAPIKEKNYETLNSFAEKIESAENMKRVNNIYNMSSENAVTVPDDAEEVNYYYTADKYDYICIYRDFTEAEKEAASEEQKKRDAENELRDKRKAAVNKLKVISNQAYELRYDFVMNGNPLKNCNLAQMQVGKYKQLCEFIARAWINEELYDFTEGIDDFAGSVGIDTESEDFESLEGSEACRQIYEAAVKKKVSPFEMLFRAFMLNIDSKLLDAIDWNGAYKHDDKLDFVYEVLTSFGYEMSDEEIALRDGTHELFIRE